MGAALDRAVLDHLRTSLGDVSGVFAARLITKFLSQSQVLLADLERACDDGDAPAMVFAAHTLRGSSSSVGGRQLAELCDEVEHWPGTPAQARSRIEAVRRELTALSEELTAYS